MSGSADGTTFLVNTGIERSLFVGLVFGAITYGMHVCIFAAAVYYTHKDRTHSYRRIRHLWPLATIWVLFVLGTFHIAGAASFLLRMWIDKRDLPGGPLQWLTEDYGDPINMLSNASTPLIFLVQDVALLYRLIIIFYRTWFRIALAILLLLVMLAAISFSVLAVIQSAQPNNTAIWTFSKTSFSIPHCSLSVGLNMIMTLLIVARLVYLRRTIVGHFGPDVGKMYTSIAAMIVESGAVYSAFGLLCIFGHALRSNIQNVSYYALLQVACISTNLIVLRVALGRAVTRETISPAPARDQHDKRTRTSSPVAARDVPSWRVSQSFSQIRFSSSFAQTRTNMYSIDEREELETGQAPLAPIVTMYAKKEGLKDESLMLPARDDDHSSSDGASHCEDKEKIDHPAVKP